MELAGLQHSAVKRDDGLYDRVIATAAFSSHLRSAIRRNRALSEIFSFFSPIAPFSLAAHWRVVPFHPFERGRGMIQGGK